MQAQDTTATSSPPADANDVASVDALIAALYDVISGEAGAERDWDRFRSLFAPGARLIPIQPTAPGEAPQATILTPEDYIERATPFFTQSGFYETEIARETDRFGHLVHVFSTYESRRSPDEAPFARGINSIQLVQQDGRWWVLTIAWQPERPDQPIPSKYLPDGR
ncbi:MAG: DUF4440 domain-containing protein [Bacteroidetes bacterium]|nr:DUF4440 domain-containing protein [Bacteroidota bacterium]